MHKHKKSCPENQTRAGTGRDSSAGRDAAALLKHTSEIAALRCAPGAVVEGGGREALGELGVVSLGHLNRGVNKLKVQASLEALPPAAHLVPQDVAILHVAVQAEHLELAPTCTSAWLLLRAVIELALAGIPASGSHDVLVDGD